MGIPYAEVIGDPIAHSRSPLIHKYWLKKLAIEGDYRAARVRPGELEDYLASRRRDEHWRGCSVTMPLKEAAFFALDRHDATAERVGAVNAIMREGGALVGCNTDVPGFLEPVAGLLWRRFPARAAVVGTGGAARAALVALSRWEVDSFAVLARRPGAAAAMLDSIGLEAEVLPVDDTSLESASILVNATPAGMVGHPPLPLELDGMSRNEPLIYDLVYDPPETELLRKARELPLAHAVNGVGMLIAQAGLAFERFFGVPAPRQHDAALRELLTR